MLRVVGKKLGTAGQIAAFLVLNEEQFSSAPTWFTLADTHQLFKKHEFINLDQSLKLTDAREGSQNSVQVYDMSGHLISKKSGVVLWAYTHADTVVSYAVFLPGGMQIVTKEQLPQCAKAYGFTNAIYNPADCSLRLFKGQMRKFPLNTGEKKIFYYFIKLSFDFYDESEVVPHVFETTTANKTQAAAEYAEEYYPNACKEGNSYNVNDEFTYNVDQIKEVSPQEYKLLKHYIG